MSKKSYQEKIYYFTAISFALIIIFFLIFVHIAPEYYTNFDILTKQNNISGIINVVFWILITFNIICIILSTICLFKIIFKKKVLDKQLFLNLFLTAYPLLLILAISSFNFITALKYFALPINLLFGQLFGNYLY